DQKAMSQAFLNYEVRNEEDLLGKGKKKKSYEEISEEELGKYIAEFVNSIEDGQASIVEKLKEYQMNELYEDIEIKLSRVLADMEIVGFVTDKEVLEKLKEEINIELDKLTKSIYELAGSEFNINSPKQLGVILFNDLKLPVIKKTKTGYST